MRTIISQIRHRTAPCDAWLSSTPPDRGHARPAVLAVTVERCAGRLDITPPASRALAPDRHGRLDHKERRGLAPWHLPHLQLLCTGDLGPHAWALTPVPLVPCPHCEWS